MAASITSLFDLTGTVSVVTGAGRGIGKAVAELLARAGASVVVSDIDQATATGTTEGIVAAGGIAAAVRSDIADEASVKALYAAAVAKFGRLDSVVHSAAIFPKYALLDITVEQWDRIHAVNLRGTMLVMREAIRRHARPRQRAVRSSTSRPSAANGSSCSTTPPTARARRA